jgi:hypothetical protein
LSQRYSLEKAAAPANGPNPRERLFALEHDEFTGRLRRNRGSTFDEPGTLHIALNYGPFEGPVLIETVVEYACKLLAV